MRFVEGKDVDGRFFARERVEVKFEGGGRVAEGGTVCLWTQDSGKF